MSTQPAEVPDVAFDLFNPTETHAHLREMLRDFVAREVEPQALEFNRDERFNLALFRKLGELDLLGITVPAEWGGAGMDAVAAVIANEELSASDPGLCLAYLAHAILYVNNVFHNANDEQRARFLPKPIKGEWVGGMCMSEPGAGTDVLGMTTAARRAGDRYVLRGEKTWITNGAIDEKTLGDIFLVYAKTEGKRISTFVVEKGMRGLALGLKIKDKLGMRSSATASLIFDDCEVPVANRLGEEGHSVTHMMRNLELERLALAAMSLGIGMRCLREMVRYAQERKAFGRSINEFGQIQKHIADGFAHWRAARTYVYDVARRLDPGRAGNRVDSDGVKLFASTMAKTVADSAIQVMGGNGYVGEFVVERLWRDAKLLEIGGGTIEAHQKNIAKDLTSSRDRLLR